MDAILGALRSNLVSILVTSEDTARLVAATIACDGDMPAAMRKKLEKDGILGRIAYRIRGEKTLNFLFEHARKEAPVPEAEP